MLRPLQLSLIIIYTVLLQSGASAQDATKHETKPGLLSKTEQYQQSIGEIGKKIENISRDLNTNKLLVATQRDKLLEVEQSLHKLSESLQNIEYDLARNQHEFDALILQVAKVKKSQANNREALRELLKSRYYQGKPDLLKKLLNQENPYAVGRLSNYNNYFSVALKNRFALLSDQALSLEELKSRQLSTIEALNEERKKQKNVKADYKKSQDIRTRTIAKLDKKIANNAQVLETLNNNRSRLKSLLTELKKQAAELKRIDELKAKQEAEQRRLETKKDDIIKPTTPSVRVPVKGGFLKQKGRLKYPVSGELTRGFGSRLPKSGMRSEGLFFSTTGSVSVKSIFRGRVLFADFLKGYGLLIIIDHGDDHISLYGHNERLLKKVGDKVDANEVIAKSGVTGGLKSHGLYFEIRDNATPIDASKWCR